MCGVHCIVDKSWSVGPESVEAMLETSKHRGQTQQYTQHQTQKYQIFFGHHLLSLTGKAIYAQQPFENEEYILVYEGEIYNWKNIDENFNFTNQSGSDTETLFHYLQKVAENPFLWGKLQGMFAFIFWDKKKNRLLTASDPYQMKPLYMQASDKKLIFSSEIRALRASACLPSSWLNREAIAHYLLFKFAPKPLTFFKDIFKHPNHLKIWNLEDFSEQIYLHAPAKPLSDLSDVVRQTEELLKKSVWSHFSHEHPTGLMLSGGVDSTLLLTLLQELDLKISSFTLACQGQNTDHYFAQKAAKQYGSKLYEVLIGEQDLELLPQLFAQADEPIADSAMLSTYLIARKAKQENCSILWSGAGADELFGGYQRHKAFYWYLKNPKLWRILGKLVSFLPKNRLQKRFFRSLHPSTEATFKGFCGLNILPKSIHTQHWTLDDALAWDRRQYLPSDILQLTDFWAMKQTVEVRLPYLDATLGSFAEQIPASTLLKNGSKWILRKILNQKNGQIYTQRTKKGFGIPFGLWLRKPKNRFLFNFLEEESHPIFQFLDKKRIQWILEKHQHVQEDFTQELFAICSLAFWLSNRTFTDEKLK